MSGPNVPLTPADLINYEVHSYELAMLLRHTVITFRGIFESQASVGDN